MSWNTKEILKYEFVGDDLNISQADYYEPTDKDCANIKFIVSADNDVRMKVYIKEKVLRFNRNIII